MKLTSKQLATLVNGKISGDETIVIEGAAGLSEAKPSDASFVRDAKNAAALKALKNSAAGVVIVPEGFTANGKTIIEVKNPIGAFAVLLEQISCEKSEKHTRGVHATAVVDATAKIGKNVLIGPHCVVSAGATIGENTTLMAQVYVGTRSSIGADTLVYPQTVIREDVSIGNRCIIHAGAVIGSDGFGFYFANGKHNKIPQIGKVIIEDEVEIGSCTTIDRATTGKTWIRTGSKIDNLVQIAHNVEVGPLALLVAQVGIAGSSRIGQGAVLAGQVGVADHITIGAGAQVGAQSGLREDVPAGAVMFGTPAQPIQDTLRQTLLIRKLPDLFKDIKTLKENQAKND